MELPATDITATDALDESAGADSRLERPLNLEHTPVFLEIDNGPRFLITFLFSFIQHGVICLDDIGVPLRLFLFKFGHRIYQDDFLTKN